MKVFITNYFISVVLLLLLSVTKLYCLSEFEAQLNSQYARSSLDTLRFVAIVSRHGSRSPLKTYPNDPYPYTNREFWPQGKGQLTNLGKRQLYTLGSKLRERYSGYLPPVYFPNDTLVTYNPNDRDFASALCLLAALYPPVGSEVWNPDLLWQPIPARVYKCDVCELMETNECPAFKIEVYKRMLLYNLEVFKNVSCLLKYVSNHTGQHLIAPMQLSEIADTLTMQDENGFTLPSWTKDVYPKELQEILAQVSGTVYAGSDKILSFSAGPELEHILSLFNMKLNGTLSVNSKMYVELSHDCTLYALLKAMGSPLSEELVRTSAYVTFELHELYSSYLVTVSYYRNSNVDQPVEISIKDCPSPCSLDNFSKFVRKVTGPKPWKTACKKKSNGPLQP